jgi:hypothetical protein
MGKVLMTVELPDQETDLGSVCRRFDLEPHEVDTAYGLVRVDKANSVYAVKIDANAASRIESRRDVHGPFADPPASSFTPDF